jgi:hypothetical protein
MWMKSRELVAGCGWGLGSTSGLGRDGDMMEGQGAMEDATFHDSDCNGGLGRAGPGNSPLDSGGRGGRGE